MADDAPTEDLSEQIQQPEVAQPDGLTALAEESSETAEVDGDQPPAEDGVDGAEPAQAARPSGKVSSAPSRTAA